MSDFYTPPSPLPGERPGDVIRSRLLTHNAALPQAGTNRLVLYLSSNIKGDSIAVSGTIATPQGQPPVVGCTHGTADAAKPMPPS